MRSFIYNQISIPVLRELKHLIKKEKTHSLIVHSPILLITRNDLGTDSFLLGSALGSGVTEIDRSPMGPLRSSGSKSVAQTQTLRTSVQLESAACEVMNPGWLYGGRHLTRHQEGVNQGRLLQAREPGLNLDH